MTVLQSAAQPTGCAKILDPVTLNRAARQGFSGLDSGTALLFFAIGLIFTLATGAIWWQYDLMSTWKFTQGISGDVQPVADQLAQRAGEYTDIALGAFIGGAIIVCITLLPSIIELIAPRVVHPGVQLCLNLCILFDFVTDWPTAASIISRYDVPAGYIGRILATAATTLALSLFVQVLFILGITVTISCALSIVGMGRRGVQQGVTVIQQ